MPVVIAAAGFLGRQVIQMAVTLGLIEAADKLLFPLVEKMVADIAVSFGVDQETAKDIVANEWIDFAEALGVGALALKTRIPLRVADYLKFTTKGVTKRAIPATTQSKVSTAKGTPVSTLAAQEVVTKPLLEQIAKQRGVSLSKVNEVVTLILKVMSFPVFLALTVAQFIDFGAWNSSAYQGTFQRLLAPFGLTPDTTYGGPRVASQEIFDKVYTAMKNEGITTIRHPDTGEVLPFNQQNALVVIDKLASKLFIEKGEVKAKALIALALALSNVGQGAAAAGAITTSTGNYSTSAAASTTFRDIKVFTGYVGGGVLGLPQEFRVRETDMIDSIEELKDAAKINLAAFVQSLPGRFFYEIVITSSIKTKTGVSIKGDAVQVISGYTSTGKPRYKTVYHKFAVMKVGVTTDTGKVVTLGTITLGPVNAVDFQPTRANIEAVEKLITPELFTSDVTKITEIVTQQPVVVSSQPSSTPPAPVQSLAQTAQNKILNRYGQPLPKEGEVFRVAGDTFRSEVWKVVNGGIQQIGQRQGIANARLEDGGKIYEPGQITPAWGPLNNVRILTPGFTGTWWSVVQAGDIYDRQNGAGAWEKLPVYNRADLEEHIALFGSLAKSAIKPANPTGQSATSLTEWYTLNGSTLPGIVQRAELYEKAGLGARSTYAGTAEQNNRLLAHLKTL